MASQMPEEVLATAEHATARQLLLQNARLWTNRIAPDIALGCGGCARVFGSVFGFFFKGWHILYFMAAVVGV